MKCFFLNVGVVLTALTLMLMSCQQKKQTAFRYSMAEFPISSVKSDLFEKTSLFLSKGKPALAILRGRDIIKLKVIGDSIYEKIKLPLNILKINYFKMFSDSELVVFSDSAIHLFENSKWNTILFEEFGKNILPLHRNGILFLPGKRTLIFTYIKHGEGINYGKFPFKTNFLIAYDLESKKTRKINLKYPEIYWDGSLGVTKIHLSSNSSKVIISFSLDPKVYILDINTEKVESIELNGFQIPLEKTPKIDKTSKKDRLDFLRFIENRFNQYGFAFQTKNGDLFRLLMPSKPEKNDDGYYFTKYEKGQEIIVKKLNQEKTHNLLLPSGFFYVSKDWNFNANNNTFYYRKLHTLKTKTDEFQTNIVSIKPFSYSF